MLLNIFCHLISNVCYFEAERSVFCGMGPTPGGGGGGGTLEILGGSVPLGP